MKRKWILAIVLALVVIAVVLAIVLVFVLKDKDTKKLAEQLNTSTTTGYLSSASEEYKEITKYLDEISATSGNLSESQVALIKNYSVIYKTSLYVSDFANRQMPFTQWTEFYSENGEKVVNNLKEAQKKAEQIKKDIASDRQIANGNATVFANLWNDRASDVTAMIDYTTGAMTTLGDIYTSCVTTKTFNNDLTEVIFNFYKAQIAKVNEELKANRESKGSSTEQTAKLNVYVNAYLDYSKVKANVVNYNNQYGDLYKTGELKVIVENLKAQGDKSYYFGKLMNGSLFTLTDESFTLTFDLGYEGAGDTTDVTFKNYEKINTTTPTREGYNFTGWKVTSDSVGTWVKDTVYAKTSEENIVLNAGNIGNVTLTAQWAVAA